MPELLAFRRWADEISRRIGFSPEADLQIGTYYDQSNIRDLVIRGTWQNQSAVLKIYDDPRLCFEPRNLTLFHQHNRSSRLTAPRLLAFEELTPKKGWLLIEHVPTGGQWFPRPMSAVQRRVFLELFEEYRRSFPTAAPDPTTIAEQLTSGEYHSWRIGRWFQLANDAEESATAAGQPGLLDQRSFIPAYERALAAIRRGMADRPMIWCHGHFKHSEVYVLDQGRRAYLIDFAHVKKYPIGYELAFMAWSDWLVGDTWRLDRAAWRAGLDDWIGELILVAERLGYSDPDRLIHASVLERVVGSVLADIVASSRPREEKQGYVDHLIPYMEFLTDRLETGRSG